MKRSLIYLMCFALSLSAIPCAIFGRAQSRPEIQLLETGTFHGEEVSAETGEQWLGLFPTENGFALIPTTINIEAVHDEVGDDVGEMTGKRVGVDRDAKPVFLIKGAGMLKAGPVASVFGSERRLGNEDLIDLKLGDRGYELKVKGKSANRADFILPDSEVLLTLGR